MKVRLLNGKKKLSFNIPESFNDLNLGRYQRLMAVLKKEDDVHEIEKVIRILNCITDIPKRQLYGLDMKSIGKLGKHLTTFLESTPTDELKHFIEIEGVEYGFHPKLVDMTLGEFVDLETYEDYEPNEERSELFKKHLTVEDFNGASVFFYDLGTTLLISSKKSLIQKQQKKLATTTTD